MTLKVFISSTGKDLFEYRQAATEICNQLKLVPIAMEFFEAMGQGATNGSKANIDECDLYVGIFAHRYGYIEKGFDKSVTEIEFDYAQERGLDRLCFVIDQSYPWPIERVEIENYARIQELKARVRLEVVAPLFTTVDDFKLKLMHALNEAVKRRSDLQKAQKRDKVLASAGIELDGNLGLLDPRNRPILNRFANVRKITLKEQVVEGNSGSQVFEVIAQFNNIPGSRPCFLKIHHSQGETPRTRHEEAYQTNLKPYMPEVLDATDWDESTKQIALLYDISKGERYVTLDKLLAEQFADAYELVEKTSTALREWNSPVQDKSVQTYDLLINALSHSADENVRKRRLEDQDGSVYARLKNEFELESTDLLLRFEGAGFDDRPVLPNPLAYLSNRSLWQRGNSLITASYGHIHGDLNTKNLLLLSTGIKREVHLIDFDTYDANNLIFLDFAQLELSILLKLCSPVYEETTPADVVATNREEIVYLSDYFSSTFKLDTLPNWTARSAGIQKIITPIRDTIWDMYNANPVFTTAFWVARMAVGLELSRKRKAKKSERVFALLYAADSLRALLRSHGLRTAKAGNSILKVIRWPTDTLSE